MNRSSRVLAAFFSLARRPRFFLLSGITGTLVYTKWCQQETDGRGKAVLITGCDTGFGNALAAELDRSGMTVFAGCLDVNGLGAQQLQRGSKGRIKLLQLDVLNEEEVIQARHHIQSAVGGTGLWGVVNNAGTCYLADIELTPQTIFRKTLDLNFLGSVFITRAFLPMLSTTQGRVVNMSSLAGKIPMEGYGAYSASKAALEAFSDVLRLEMRKWNVGVSIIEPAGFQTNAVSYNTVQTRKEELWEGLDDTARERYGKGYLEAMYQNFEASIPSYSSDVSPVVNAVKAALLSRRPRARYQAGTGAATMIAVMPFLPQWLYDTVVTFLGFGVKQVDTKEQKATTQV